MQSPIYTDANCTPSYELYWSVSLFWRAEAVAPATWLRPLKEATEADGVRILEHRTAGPTATQFLVSTKPQIPPQAILRSLKARLQYLVSGLQPKAFRRNYSIRSVGKVKREIIDRYVASQLGRHRMPDDVAQRALEEHVIECKEVDLSKPRRTSYGEYLCNLHVVFAHRERWCEVRREVRSEVHNMILGASKKKGYLLSRARIVADHVHLEVGIGVGESPADVALGYMNNLAFAQGMNAVYQYGFYVGTFGEYDLGAIRQALRRSPG